MTIFEFLSQDLIRSHATGKSWQRGEDYYANGYVRSVVVRGTSVSATVEGNHYRPYRVDLNFENEDLAACSCTCPYDYGGICKHQVATLLVCLHEPHTLQPRPTIHEILDRLSDIQTQTLIQKLVAKKPELIADIEDICDRLAPVTTPTTSADLDSRKITVDASKIRSQVSYIIKDMQHALYNGEYIEEDLVTPEIEELITEAYSFKQQEEHWNAITMLTAITDACVENWHLIDEYGMDYDEISHSLNRAWSEVILSTLDISPVDKTDLEVQFEFWRNQWGNCFAMAETALNQGWDYLPLKQILEGNSVSLWSGEPPSYATELATIRLQILDEQDKLTEYLNLADATGLVAKHLTMLVSLDRIPEAINSGFLATNLWISVWVWTSLRRSKISWIVGRVCRVWGSWRHTNKVATWCLQIPP